MLSRLELLDAIDELEKSATTFQDCQKLATFVFLYDNLYGEKTQEAPERTRMSILEDYGTSEFYQAIKDKEAEKVLRILNETMDAIQILQPRLYDSVLTQLSEADKI